MTYAPSRRLEVKRLIREALSERGGNLAPASAVGRSQTVHPRPRSLNAESPSSPTGLPTAAAAEGDCQQAGAVSGPPDAPASGDNNQEAP